MLSTMNLATMHMCTSLWGDICAHFSWVGWHRLSIQVAITNSPTFPGWLFCFLSSLIVSENLSCSSPDFLMFPKSRETLMEIQALPLSSFAILRQLVNFYLSFPIYKMGIIIIFCSVCENWRLCILNCCSKYWSIR